MSGRATAICSNQKQCQKILGVEVSNNLKWNEHLRSVVNDLRYRIFTIRRLTYNLPRKYLQGLLDGIVYSKARYCLPLFSKLRLSGQGKKNKWMEAVQKQLNAALRVVLGVKLSDKVSINELHSMTNMLTFNQIYESGHFLPPRKTLAHSNTYRKAF
jgi:hypothetical protein